MLSNLFSISLINLSLAILSIYNILIILLLSLPITLTLFFKWLVLSLRLIRPKFFWMFSTKLSLGPYKLGSVVASLILLSNSALVSTPYTLFLFIIIV